MQFNHARYLPILIIGISMFLRLWLGLINREANDDHVSVVNLTLLNHALPEKNDCWSCYQPKLFYIICAGAVKLFNIEDTGPRIVLMQLINVCFGFFILLLFWNFIKRQNLNDGSKYLALALFAFNPCLLGINIQHTNDTQAIFFGVLATFACFKLFQTNSIKWGVILVAALIAGTLTKASILVLAGAIVATITLKILALPLVAQKIKTAKYLLAGVLVFLLIVPFAGGYYLNYKNYNSLTISTWEKDPPPHFFKKTDVARNGVQSMFTGFFTFRFVDLVRHPVITNDMTHDVNAYYPVHRTSLWSQMYGRTVFMHFDKWPPSWMSDKPFILEVGRLLIILGIVPLLLFLAGIFSNAVKLFKSLLRCNRDYLSEPQNHFYMLATLAFLASSVFYTYTYRDFSSMKSIYIFPGLLAFIKMFIDGHALLKSKRLVWAVNAILVVVVLLSITDIIFLMHQLRHNSPCDL